MELFEKSMTVMRGLFRKDIPFSFATVKDGVPSLRVVDFYYDGTCFYIVTYAGTQKVTELEANPHVAFCNNFYRFTGKAENIGHPLRPENNAIREQLVKVFEPWYFAHNNEADEGMCYVRVKPETGFFHQNGTGYKVDFVNRSAEEFPFAPDIVEIN